jgi:hypothetical protein
MATREEILAQIARIDRELETGTAELSALQFGLQRLRQSFVDETDQAKINQISQQLQQIGREIAAKSQQLTDLRNQRIQLVRQLNRVETTGTTTPVVNNNFNTDAVVNAGGAVRVSPPPEPTNAQVTPTVASGSVAFGTNGRVLPTSISQAPAGNTIVGQASVRQAVTDDQAETGAKPSGNQPGVAAQSDDSSQNLVQQRVDSLYLQNQTVLPKDNILDQFASYTYNISVYLMSPGRYREFITDSRGFFEQNTLLFQSGGAPPSNGYTDLNQVVSSVDISIREKRTSRNPYFDQDFFIDDVELKTVIIGKGQGSAHNSTLLNFTVTEYNGITLLQNLDRAVVDYIYKSNPALKKALEINPDLGTYGSQIYMMVIRFYGYDDNGNLVTGGTNNPNATTDPQAVVEKYIPFVVKNITFKVGSRAVQYFWECATPGTSVNTGPTSATVPYNCQLSGKTLGDALSGELITVYQPNSSSNSSQREIPDPSLSQQAAIGTGPLPGNPSATRVGRAGQGIVTAPTFPNGFTTSPQIIQGTSTAATNNEPQQVAAVAPPKADSAKSVTETVTQGLMAAMNRYQQEIFALGQIQIPNQYSVEFTSTAISDAKLTYRGRTDRDLVPAANSNNPRNLLPEAQSADTDKKIFSITAGQQLVQVIEMLVRNSTYISDQQTVIVDPVTGVQLTNPGRTKNLAWFKINMVASPIGYDFKRKDYAWSVKYIISEYRIVAPETGYFPIVDFPGFHKSYPYWFTGENKSIINFEQQYNYQYHRVLSGGILDDTTSADYRDFTKTVFYPRSGQSTHGGPLRTNEAAANLADYFYSPGDQKTVELEIIGDPAWIFQGESSGLYNLSIASGNPFLADGTINVDYGQVFFELSWNSPEDYDVNGNGLMNPSKNYTQSPATGLKTGTPKQSYAYGARTCTSHFRQGKFTQTLDGYLVIKNLNSQIAQDNQREILAASDRVLLSRVAPDINRELNERADRQLIARTVQPVNNNDNSRAAPLRNNIDLTLGDINNNTRTDQLMARDE